MANDEDRCPLCGGAAYDGHYETKCTTCGLPEKYWPRVRELVAIRDAAVEWCKAGDAILSTEELLIPKDLLSEFYDAIRTLEDLVKEEIKRQEAKKGAKDVRKQK